MEVVGTQKMVGVVENWIEGGEGRGYHILTGESVWHYTEFWFRGVAQLVARRVWDAEVRGSSPRTPTHMFR